MLEGRLQRRTLEYTGYSAIVEKADGLTNIVRSADDLPDLLGVLDDAGHLQVAQLDLTVGKLAHQHDILRLKKEETSTLEEDNSVKLGDFDERYHNSAERLFIKVFYSENTLMSRWAIFL
jgi:hypothetical protein